MNNKYNKGKCNPETRELKNTEMEVQGKRILTLPKEQEPQATQQRLEAIFLKNWKLYND